MTSSVIRQFLVIILMMFAGFYVQELPTSNVLQTMLPEWPFLLSLYFSVSSRFFYGMVFAFTIGLCQDVFLAAPFLGVNSLVYMLSTFFMIMFRMSFKHLSIFVQSFVIGGLVIFKILVIGVFSSVIHSFPNHLWILLSIPTTMLMWPLLHMFFGFFASKQEG